MRLSDQYNVAEFRSRAFIVAVLFCLCLFLLICRLWYLQIWQGEKYRGFSDNNRFKIERLSAPRGQLLDRNGELLADSRPRFDLTFTRGNSQDLDEELRRLGGILKWNQEDLDRRVAKLKVAPQYQAQAVAEDITEEQLTYIEHQSLDFPGVDVEVVAVRDYLYKDQFFHAIGYTGEINDQELPRLKERYPERNYRLGDEKGVSGIEAAYEAMLRGVDGRDFIVVDAKGRRVNQEQWELLPQSVRQDPVAGLSLQLTIDRNLQQVADQALGSRAGAVIALEPETGQVLAYLSKPALDPNIFTRPVSSADFQRMMSSPKNPFLDRVVGEHYPPGSTLKLVMAAAALETGVIDERTTYFCPGSFRFGSRTWKCWQHQGHGRVNVVQAIEQSCDVFFYNTGLALGLDSMFSWATRFGLGRRTFIGNEVFPGMHDTLTRFNSEGPGFIPSVDWIRSKRQTSVEAETINAAIGQGAYTVTAIQMARILSAIGNGGKMFQPQLVLESKNSSGEVVKHYDALLENTVYLSESVKEAVLKGMLEVINGNLGTARGSRLKDIEFGGKTGTAQVAGLEVAKAAGKNAEFLQDHALFVGLAPLHHPKIAVAVIVENGGHGSSAAAPVAKAMIKAYLDGLQASNQAAPQNAPQNKGVVN